ncbi:MAG: AraC family transcriptional regulator [Gammaproteobacteria bacterium]|nr:AraC family transcriptional regulator [Gammaproteobacteria bacterium]
METISPIYARLILRELERRGIDPGPLLAGTSLTRNELARGGDIGMEDFLHILRKCDQLLGDEQLGLLLGRKLHVFAMGPVGAAMAAAPDLRRGLQILENFSRLHATYIDIRSGSSLPGLTVTILYGHETGDVERFHSETAMLLLQQYMETLAAEAIQDAHYRFAHPLPENQDAYRHLFHGTISFDADASEVDIAHRWLDHPSPYYDAALWRQAQLSLARDLKEKSASERAPYAQHIATLLRTSEVPLPDLDEVALSLHVSARTLNRRLQAESASFRQLKSLALSSRAKLYLRETDQSVEAIAETLGYRDTANFRRAFRKSEGCSPHEYRQQKSRTP